MYLVMTPGCSIADGMFLAAVRRWAGLQKSIWKPSQRPRDEASEGSVKISTQGLLLRLLVEWGVHLSKPLMSLA